MKCLGVSVVAALVPLLGCAEAREPTSADAGNLVSSDASTASDASVADASPTSPDATPIDAAPDARIPACGDNIQDAGEACDDGNTTDGDGCSANCLSDESCGNGTHDVLVGEVCDDSNIVDGDGCSASCLSDESCGNGTHDVLVGEACDDSNVIDGDGCSASCLSDESCGNGTHDVLVGEVCDDSNIIDADGCSANCLSDETCGNGTTDGLLGEVCDDSNIIAGDGCALDCLSAAALVAEDFEPDGDGTISLPGWSMIDVDGRTADEAVPFMTAAWIFGEDGFESGPDNTIAVSTSFYSPTGRADDWLITPQLSLDSHSTLRWRSYTPDSDFRDGYEVRVSTTTPDVAGFMANSTIFSVSSDATSWGDHVVELAAEGYANQDIYIAFRNNTNDRFLLLLDDVIVE